MKILYKFTKELVFLVLVLLNMAIYAQTFECKVTNDYQISDRIYQFDVYIYRTGSIELNLNSYQFSFKYNNSTLLLNGGTLSALYVLGSSELTGFVPSGVSLLPALAPNYIRVNGPSPSSSGIIIPTSGLRVGTFRITNTVAFGLASMNLTWNNATPATTSVRRVAVSPELQPVAITNSGTYIPLLHNLVLNQPPSAQSVTGTGSYCIGSSGLPVGISSSEFGVNYTLYKNGIAQAPTDSGRSGLPITFGNQLFGTYTIRGTNFGGTVTMTGSAVITENPLPTITTAASTADVCYSISPQTTPLVYSATSETPTTYSITWSPTPSNSFVAVTNATLPASPITISVPASTPIGTYTGTITVKNANGCVSVGTTFTVTVKGGLTAPANTTATVSCPANATDPGAPADITDACGRTISAVADGSTSTLGTPACNGTVVWKYKY
ncbi:MAG: hypothetical protein WCH34_18495, partial [Bacteroidota bacterium]